MKTADDHLNEERIERELERWAFRDFPTPCPDDLKGGTPYAASLHRASCVSVDVFSDRFTEDDLESYMAERERDR